MIYRRLAFFSLVFYLVTYLSYSKENEGAVGTTESIEEIYQLPEIKSQPSFLETFQKESMTTNYFNEKEWIKSSEEKYTTQDVAVKSIFTTLGKWNNDQALVLETSHKHYGLVHPLKELFHLNNEKNRYAVLQYEVTLTEGLECGGAYLKLLNEKENKNQQWNQFNDKTGYSIMFGPDKCGSSSKVHLIIRHYDPKRQIYEEKALKDQPAIRNDKLTHLYTLVLDKKENLYEIWIDMEKVKSGSLFQDFEPAFQPLEKIDDPNDKKPKDWVDVKEIPDPNAVKPDDWDENAPRTIVDEDAVKPEDWLDNEPETVSDPSAVKPEDWDDEEDGEWEAPLVPNPKCKSASGCGEWKRPNKPNPAYKGKWSAPMIDNPAYKGEWKPRKISNPNYYEVMHPAQIEPINAIAIEIWTITGGIAFDNIWLGYNPDEAKEFAENTWKLKFAEQSEESKLKEQEKNDRVRELTLEKGTWLDIMRLRMDDIKEFCNSNPQYAFGIGATILMILVTAFLMRNKTHTIPSEETDIQQSPDEEVSEEEKEETENDDNKEKQEVKDESTDKQEVEAEEDVNSSEGVRMRKKTPKAD